MAIRHITVKGEEILRKKCKPVPEINDRILQLLDDMVETMNDADGVGLAAPQVGIMKRLFVCKPFVEEEEGQDVVIKMINPEILESEGSQLNYEGCLSVPGYFGAVDRPERVLIRYQDTEGEYHEEEFAGFGAIVVSHEYDHLDGVLYTDKAENVITSEEYDRMIEEAQAERESKAE
jgi:peptide deformylase